MMLNELKKPDIWVVFDDRQIESKKKLNVWTNVKSNNEKMMNKLEYSKIKNTPTCLKNTEEPTKLSPLNWKLYMKIFI